MANGLLLNARSFLGNVWRLAAPYWRSEDRRMAWLLLVAVVALTLALVYLNVLFNYWSRDFFDALQNKAYDDFWALILYFCFLAAVYIAIAVYEIYLQQMLLIRWRTWLTDRYLGDWLGHDVHYRLELDNRGTDNPDQRIADDLRLFADRTLSLGLGVLNAVVTLVSFIAILWTISGPLDFTVGGRAVSIPGYMVWVAVAYALVGSVLAHYVGRPLIALNFQRERVEADFRFSMVRLRENSEGVALYRGAPVEMRFLRDTFGRVIGNWWGIMRYTKRLNTYQSGYTQIAIVFPYLVAAPRYFSGAITLGVLQQVANAFGQVQGSLSWFVNNYDALAAWKATVDRLITFHRALEETAAEEARHTGIAVQADAAPSIRAEQLDLALPNGRSILTDAAFTIEPGERLLVTGPSGAGKSTLFRAIAGIWPYGRGRIGVPASSRVLFLPQKPYIPIGTLRDAAAYPGKDADFTDDQVREALAAVGLAHLVPRLAERQNWTLQLSGGEQQRLAVARALLQAPDWLFLDEATASVDEAAERDLYELLAGRLPRTAIVSIAHRPTVAAFHRRRLAMKPDGDGMRLEPA